MEDISQMTSQQALCDPTKQRTRKRPGLSTLKLFIVALSFAYFSKALTGTYMKSSITQIERRFDLSSTHVSLIDGSFEMGNLLFLALVSHFGARLHRPRLIAAGCLLMAAGALLIGSAHFFMGRYKYDTIIQNNSTNISACVDPLKTAEGVQIEESVMNSEACARESGSNMWVYIFLANALRGIGETPVTPLGISYIDDFARAENSPIYIACLQTVMLLGPMFGFLLGSYCAKLYVDIGYVDMDGVTITPRDARWVGAWWLGFLVSSSLLLVSSIPFWFLPRSLPKQEGEEDKSAPRHVSPDGTEETLSSSHNLKLTEIAKGFLPSLKRLLGTPVYFLFLCGAILESSSMIGFFTFKAKYMEQQFGQSASRANFLLGVLNLPAAAMGIFLGGLIMRRYKLSVVSGAQLCLTTTFMGYLLLLLLFGTKCDNLPVAGLTVSYNGLKNVSYDTDALFSGCNADCSCSAEEWDPVCSASGVTYVSPCLAGCLTSSGHGKNTVFHNCSCVSESFPVGSTTSVRLGQCPHAKDCSSSFTSYMAISVLSFFIIALGVTPSYMVIIRCISPDLKSLALGIQALGTRTLGGIPAPMYFGALIDSTCLKWSMKKCGGRGACRIYDSDMYRVVFLGLITCLSGSSFFFLIAVIVLLRRQFRRTELEAELQRTKASQGIELKASSNAVVEERGAGSSNSSWF
ncbi:solute carrier organic anion transporter family member 1C1 isoform X2 [Austrofundulus limnaeus]|uniref:Solute carrier organic anion transporter family member n=1 Tax=Austrofundulus limnaeus TaxID=52670 RepID=A0A2I4C2T9_AUSLI|nr:PREDICTED: solute carrier organic anion transporter family member 1C1-like isoform X2 [Austrofundulus limnaeus]